MRSVTLCDKIEYMKDINNKEIKVGDSVNMMNSESGTIIKKDEELYIACRGLGVKLVESVIKTLRVEVV